jgi:hypothetical protein
MHVLRNECGVIFFVGTTFNEIAFIMLNTLRVEIGLFIELWLLFLDG